MAKKIVRKLKIILALLVFMSLISWGFLAFQLYEIKPSSSLTNASITSVVDGDTLDSSLGKIRLLGVNTPEKGEQGYEQASNYLKQLENKTVLVERVGENKDKYSRLLRYVFYNGLFVNKEILALGFAHYYAYDDDKYTKTLLEAEQKARELALGLWEKSKEACASCISLIELKYLEPEYVLLKNNCSFSCNLNQWSIYDDSSSHKKVLDFSIEAGEQRKIDYGGKIWNDAGDSLYLRDKSGKLVIFYRY